jgi:hypothetical protein
MNKLQVRLSLFCTFYSCLALLLLFFLFVVSASTLLHLFSYLGIPDLLASIAPHYTTRISIVHFLAIMNVNCLEMSFQSLQIPRQSLSRVVLTLLGRRLQWNVVQSQHHFVFLHGLHSLNSTTVIHLSLLAPLLFSTIDQST